MSSHAAVRPLQQRLLSAGAFAAAILLVGLGVSQVAGATPAQAAANLSCDQNTIYSIQSGSNAGAVNAIDLTTGTTTALPSFGTANNALGISPNGTAAYAAVNATSANANGSITKYDAATGATTTITGVNVPATTIRGAVDPVNGIYYYGQGGSSTPALYAYNTITGEKIGQVGTIGGLASGNGDFAFSTTGILYVAAANQVVRVNEAVPTTSGSATLTTSLVTTLPSGTNSPGIAFSTNGYLYVASTSNLLKIDPSSGTLASTLAISGGYSPTDLASCNYPDSISAQSSVNTRWQPGDQFAVTTTGDGIAAGNTATSSGTATGTQTATAGPNLVIPGDPYTVTQTAAGTTDLANYSTSYLCTDVNSKNTVASGSGSTATLSVPQAPTSQGVDITCDFTNTLTAKHAQAVDDSYSTPTNQTLTAPAGSGLVANDTGTGVAFQANTAPSHGSVTVNSDGSFSFVPDQGFAGTDSFTYTDTDSSGTVSEPGTVTVVVGPVAAPDSYTTPTGQSLTTTKDDGVLANDSGTGLLASNASTPTSGTVTLNGDGSFVLAPATGYSGLDTFTYTVTDRGGHTATGTVSVTVLPQAVDDTLPGAVAGSTTTIATSTALQNDLGSNLAVTAVGSARHGKVTLDSTNTSFLYTPAPGYSGPDAFSYTVTDSNGSTSTATAKLTVAPVATPDTGSTTTGQSLTVDAAHGVLANDLGAGLTSAVAKGPGHGTLTLAADGSYSYVPAPGYSGSDSFTYTLTDSAGSTAVVAVTLTVHPLAVTAPITVAAGSTGLVPAPGILAGDEGTGLALTAIGATGKPGTPVTTSADGTITVGADGSVAYAAPAGFSGTDTVPYTITDSSGISSTGSIVITVAPHAVDDSLTTPANTPLAIAPTDLLSNDAGSRLAFGANSQPTHGTLTKNADGSFSYTPTQGFSGTDSFTYSVTDASGQHTTATVWILVGDLAADYAQTTDAGKTLAVPAADGLLSDASGSGLTATLDAGPSHGTVVVASDGSYRYQPAKGFSGTDSFTYTVTDSAGQISTGTVTVRVAIAAVDYRWTTHQSRALRVPVTNALLSSDSGTGLTAALAAAPTHGTATIDPDGACVYTPKPGFTGTDSFQYTATDAYAQSVTRTATITVTPGPSAKNDTATGRPGQKLTLSPMRGDVASEGARFMASSLALMDPATGKTVTSFRVAGKGTFDVVDSQVTFAPEPAFHGTATMAYQVTDTDDQTASALITVRYPTVPAVVTGIVTGVVSGATAPVAKALAFTGSTPFGGILLIAIGGIALGLLLRIRKHIDEPHYRRTGL